MSCYVAVVQPQENSEIDNDISELEAWKRRALSLELTEQYLLELLQVKERQLEAIFRSPAWKLSKPLRLLNLIAWKINPDLEKAPNIGLRDSISTTGPTVIELESKQAHFELNNIKEINKESKVAIVACYTNEPELSPSLRLKLQYLVDQGFSVTLVVASDQHSKMQIGGDLEKKISVIRKRNLGYDFGSWSIGNHLIPNIAAAKEVLLLNDSVILDASRRHYFVDLVRKANSSSYDVTSATDSYLHSYHLQSYFLHFKNGSFGSSRIQRFLNEVRPQPSKEAVIFAYEIGLSLILRNYGFTTGSIFPWNQFSNSQGNASINSWKELLSSGSPFIKKEVFKSLSKVELASLETELVDQLGFDADALRQSLQETLN
jgi:hypothetical protein